MRARKKQKNETKNRPHLDDFHPFSTTLDIILEAAPFEVRHANEEWSHQSDLFFPPRFASPQRRGRGRMWGATHILSPVANHSIQVRQKNRPLLDDFQLFSTTLDNILEPPVGLEPTTYGLRYRRSTS